MVKVTNGAVQLQTDCPAESWYYRVRNRLLVLSAAAANKENGPLIQEAISAEIDDIIEMIPDEKQMEAALRINPA